MLHKSFDDFELEADAEAGTFEATVAVFGNVDRGGDRILPGAFEKTLAAWKASGDPIPVIFNHDWSSPMAHVGVVTDAKETTKGLWVKGALDINDNDVARQVHRLMSRRSLKEFSFGYEVPAGGEKRAKDGANDLSEIVLAEVGPTLKGMNDSTELHSVKSALEKNTETADDEKDTELQEVKDRLESIERALEDLREKAEETGEDPDREGRQPDPLRQQADDVALEVASGGVSRLPHKQERDPEPEPKPDLMDLDDLRKVSRDLMLQVLSGGASG